MTETNSPTTLQIEQQKCDTTSPPNTHTSPTRSSVPIPSIEKPMDVNSDIEPDPRSSLFLNPNHDVQLQSSSKEKEYIKKELNLHENNYFQDSSSLRSSADIEQKPKEINVPKKEEDKTDDDPSKIINQSNNTTIKIHEHKHLLSKSLTNPKSHIDQNPNSYVKNPVDAEVNIMSEDATESEKEFKEENIILPQDTHLIHRQRRFENSSTNGHGMNESLSNAAKDLDAPPPLTTTTSTAAIVANTESTEKLNSPTKKKIKSQRKKSILGGKDSAVLSPVDSFLPQSPIGNKSNGIKAPKEEKYKRKFNELKRKMDYVDQDQTLLTKFLDKAKSAMSKLTEQRRFLFKKLEGLQRLNPLAKAGSLEPSEYSDFERAESVASVPTTKKRRRRDKNAPKRPPNGYMTYCIQERERLLKERDQLRQEGLLDEDNSLKNLTKERGARWRALPEEEKKRFQEIAKMNMDKWVEDTKIYQEKLASENNRSRAESFIKEDSVMSLNTDQLISESNHIDMSSQDDSMMMTGAPPTTSHSAIMTPTPAEGKVKKELPSNLMPPPSTSFTREHSMTMDTQSEVEETLDSTLSDSIDVEMMD